MWGYVAYEAATSLHDMTTTPATTTPWQRQQTQLRRSTRKKALKGILRVTTAALVAHEQGGRRRVERANRWEQQGVPALRATPVGAHNSNNKTLLGKIQKTNRTRGRKLTATIHVSAAARPSSRPPGPLKARGSAEGRGLGG